MTTAEQLAQSAIDYIAEHKDSPEECMGYSWQVFAHIAGYQGPAPWDGKEETR